MYIKYFPSIESYLYLKHVYLIADILEEFPQFPLSTSVSVGGNVTLNCSPPMGSRHPTMAWTHNSNEHMFTDYAIDLYCCILVALSVRSQNGLTFCEYL